MRRAMTFFLVLLLLLCTPAFAAAEPATGDFADIQGHWAEGEIRTACNLGLMSGVGTTAQRFKIFNPEAAVSRAELVSVLERTFQLDYGNIRFIKEPVASDYYQDVEDKAWYSGALVLCAINGILDDDVDFKPGEPVTRIEVARAIWRSFTAKNIIVPMTRMMPIYADTGSLTDEDRNAVVFVSNTGIMKGDGGNFRPGEPVKRAELARVLNRCAQLIALNQNSNGQEYTVPVGQTFILFLNSNPSTGYQWNKDSWDEEVVSLTSRNFEAGGNKALVGQEGKEGFVFKALKTGSTEIKLNYARPWESVQPEETYNLKVKVVAPQSESAEVQMSLKPVKSKNDLVDVELNIPQIEGLKNEQVQSAINRHFMEDANALKDDLEAEADEAKRGSEQSGYTFQPYGLWSICEKYCENGDILSLYVDYYTYTGGAHGSTERRAYNYDLQTGERLELKDLFKMGYDYKAALNEQVKARIAARPENYFDGDMGFQGINESNFYLENNILMLYFDEYEIAPYAVGIPQFKLPLNLFGNNLKDEY